METITVSIELYTTNCGECGGSYGINKQYRDQKYRDGGYWNCPYCQCSWGYSKADSETGRLKKQIESKDRAIERARRREETLERQRDTAEHRRRGEKAAKTRLRNKIAKGLCPCCGESFADLREHIENQHPDFAPAAGGE